jgi:DNA-binding MarR family transcriptional regulator
MFKNYINEFRQFNRFYTAYIGILNRSFMNTKYSLPQARVLHAIYVKDGITPSEIASDLNMDKSYLSRILIAFERKKLISKKISATDGRVSHLHITSTGKKDFEGIDEASNKQVERLLVQMTEEERKAVMASMSTLRSTLSKYKL